MVGKYSKFIKEILLVGDIICLNTAFVTGLYYLHRDIIVNEKSFSLMVLINLAWLLIVNYLLPYRFGRVLSFTRTTAITFKHIAIHIAFIMSIFFVSNDSNLFSKSDYVIAYSVYVMLLLLWRLLFFTSIRAYRSKGFNYRTVVIVGNGYTAQQIYNYVTSELTLGYRLVGVFTDNQLSVDSDKVIGTTDDCLPFLKENHVDEILCALRLTEVDKINELVEYADNNLERFRLIPDFRGISNRRLNLEFFEQIPVLTIRKEPLESLQNRIIKRLFDLSFSFIVLLVLLPIVFPIVALLIKLSSSGPVFFNQLRNGRNNKEFKVFKFRTMEVNQDSDKVQASKNDGRITKIGSFLRKTNLDELPQFINVFVGNMSVVGPRPHMLKHTQEYSNKVDKFLVRQFVKPGITGWAQVKGYRGATDDNSMKKRIQHDLWYIENWSLLLDIQIILMTVYNMIKGEENAY